MHLITATAEFKIHGQSRPGFPILLWEDMTSCIEANAFMRFYLITRGAVASSKSWESTGRALYDYFGFLEANHLTWSSVEHPDEKSLVATYRDYSLDVAHLAVNTVRQRLLYICEFYAYAFQKKWIATLPFEYETRHARKHGRFLAHLQGRSPDRSTPNVMPRRQVGLPKFLTRLQTAKLLGSTTNPHHLMLMRTALHTGLRREELASLPASYIFNPDTDGSSTRNIRVFLDPSDGSGMKTKGSRTRTILVGRTFMRELYRYATLVRGERASCSNTPQKSLFLTQSGEPWAGDGKGIEKIVRELGERVGIRTHPHMLRHTYATHMLYSLQRKRQEIQVEPIVFIQKQLGHASITTTMIYLHLINELVDDAVLAYDEELDFSEGQE